MKRISMRSGFIELFFIALMVLLPATAIAQGAAEKCTCTPNTFDVRWKDADAVFVGTVKSIKTIEKYAQYGTEDLPVEVTLLVDDSYKGAEAGKNFILHTSLTRKTCTGHPFEPWKKYLVFAYRREAETYETWSLYNFPSKTYDVGGLCGGTKKVGSAGLADDLKRIREKQAAPPEKRGFRYFFNN